MKDYHKVTEIVPGERVTLKTNHGDFSARRVIITAGPWTPKIMKQLGVELPIVVRFSVSVVACISVSYRGQGALGFPTPSYMYIGHPLPSFADSTAYFVLLFHTNASVY